MFVTIINEAGQALKLYRRNGQVVIEILTGSDKSVEFIVDSEDNAGLRKAIDIIAY